MLSTYAFNYATNKGIKAIKDNHDRVMIVNGAWNEFKLEVWLHNKDFKKLNVPDVKKRGRKSKKRSDEDDEKEAYESDRLLQSDDSGASLSSDVEEDLQPKKKTRARRQDFSEELKDYSDMDDLSFDDGNKEEEEEEEEEEEYEEEKEKKTKKPKRLPIVEEEYDSSESDEAEKKKKRTQPRKEKRGGDTTMTSTGAIRKPRGKAKPKQSGKNKFAGEKPVANYANEEEYKNGDRVVLLATGETAVVRVFMDKKGRKEATVDHTGERKFVIRSMVKLLDVVLDSEEEAIAYLYETCKFVPFQQADVRVGDRVAISPTFETGVVVEAPSRPNYTTAYCRTKNYFKVKLDEGGNVVSKVLMERLLLITQDSPTFGLPEVDAGRTHAERNANLLNACADRYGKLLKKLPPSKRGGFWKLSLRQPPKKDKADLAIRERFEKVGKIKAETEHTEAADKPAHVTAMFNEEGQRIWVCESCGKKSKVRFERTTRFCSTACSHMRVSSYRLFADRKKAGDDKENDSKNKNPKKRRRRQEEEDSSSEESSEEESEYSD